MERRSTASPNLLLLRRNVAGKNRKMSHGNSSLLLLGGGQDVWFIILEMLDGRDIAAMECVCRAWCEFLRRSETDRLLWKKLVLNSDRGEELMHARSNAAS